MTPEGCDTGPIRSSRRSLSPSPGRPKGTARAIALVSAPVDGAPLLSRRLDRTQIEQASDRVATGRDRVLAVDPVAVRTAKWSSHQGDRNRRLKRQGRSRGPSH
jgi:hypothetical protein